MKEQVEAIIAEAFAKCGYITARDATVEVMTVFHAAVQGLEIACPYKPEEVEVVESIPMRRDKFVFEKGVRRFKAAVLELLEGMDL